MLFCKVVLGNRKLVEGVFSLFLPSDSLDRSSLGKFINYLHSKTELLSFDCFVKNIKAKKKVKQS